MNVADGWTWRRWVVMAGRAYVPVAVAAERALGAAFRSAIELDARNADARHWLSMSLLTGFGSRDASIREQANAARLNPVSSMNVGVLGWQRYLRGEYELSRAHMEPALDLNADLEEAHAGLARVAARLGDERTVMSTITGGRDAATFVVTSWRSRRRRSPCSATPDGRAGSRSRLPSTARCQ